MRRFFVKDTSRTVIDSVIVGLILIVGAIVLLAILLRQIPFGLHQVQLAMRWFDPWFVQYNVTLAIFAVLIVPFLTIHYVASRRHEKARRLKRELCDRRGHGKPVWGDSVEHCYNNVDKLVHDQFQLRAYGPAMIAMMVTITFGVGILLLAKPVFHDANGVDYSAGANMLLLGANWKFYVIPNKDMFRQVLMSLCAFQYGFLGAFIYAITTLVWSYFNVDLTPHALVAGTVRMITASVLALVASFCLPENFVMQYMPTVAFFLGYFPNRALLLIERTGRTLLKAASSTYTATQLHSLPGLGLNDEWRLSYEGLDSLEHMEGSDPLDLAIRTGYSYTQLCTWRDQAWLATRMRDDYVNWIAKTGILGREELRDYFRGETKPVDQVIANMSSSSGVAEVKLRALYVLLCGDQRQSQLKTLLPVDPRRDEILPAQVG